MRLLNTSTLKVKKITNISRFADPLLTLKSDRDMIAVIE